MTFCERDQRALIVTACSRMMKFTQFRKQSDKFAKEKDREKKIILVLLKPQASFLVRRSLNHESLQSDRTFWKHQYGPVLFLCSSCRTCKLPTVRNRGMSKLALWSASSLYFLHLKKTPKAMKFLLQRTSCCTVPETSAGAVCLQAA